MESNCKYLDTPISKLMSDDKTASIMTKWLEPWLLDNTSLTIDSFYQYNGSINSLMENMGGGMPYKILTGIKQDLINFDKTK